MIQVMIVDDHTLVRNGLCRLIDGERDMNVMGQSGSGHDAVRLCREKEPDVVLLDYNLPDIDGLETTQQIVTMEKGIRILILTMYANEEYATRLIRAGASGFLVKAASTDELLAAIRKVASRGIYISPTVMDKMVDRITQPPEGQPETLLSDREMQVLLRLSRGATTREVARSLSLSMSTVETYRSHILEKLCIRNNSDMTRFAIRRGLIELD
jgi:DNA-binding NarL/FixJ family response regulator